MIKINHITNLHDARFAAAENVDFISFALAKGNTKKISLTTYQEIIPWIAGTFLVVDFENDIHSLIDFLNKNIPFDYLQIHENLLYQIPNELYHKIFVFTHHLDSAQKLLEQGLLVETPFPLLHNNHFQLISYDTPKKIHQNYSLDRSFFLETYELDYERFNEWNQNF